MTERRFPILLSERERKIASSLGCPLDVPWALLAPHEAQAASNHGGQTLDTLASRGGLGPDEMVAVIEGRKWRFMLLSDSVARLLLLIASHGGSP